MTLKSHIVQWTVVAKHLNTHERSLRTAEKRFSQGLPFFTAHLPSLGKDLEAGLTGRFVLSVDTPFSVKRGTSLPAFLFEHFVKVFHTNGYVRSDPVGIADLRLLLKMYYKFESPLTREGLQEAVAKFNMVDESVKTDHYPFGLAEVRKYFTSLFPDFPRDIRPHHSGGASSLRYSNLEKRTARHNIPRLMDVFGAQYFFNSITHASNWCAVNETAVVDALPRVTFVPKDSRGPRTICIYHHMDMFIQKGLQAKLYDFTEQGYSPARGYINFTDQGINQRLAYEGSITGKIATIDLKDASDLVPWNLIRLLAPSDWYAALAATRTDEAEIQGRRFPLKKYAPMGSALCFPIEAFLFWSIAKTVSPWVYVYGDDIIVPIETVHDVIAALESYGLVVNTGKTLFTGNFRESCGGDYYDGHNINYTSCKSYDLQQYIAFCNEVAVRHSQKLAEELASSYEDLYGEVFFREPIEFRNNPEPYIFYTDSCASSDIFFKCQGDPFLMREEVYRRHVVSKPESDKERKFRIKSRNSRRTTVFNTVEDDLLFDWFSTAESSVAPNEDAYYSHITAGLFTLSERPTAFSEGHETLRQDLYPVTKYKWGPRKIRG